MAATMAAAETATTVEAAPTKPTAVEAATTEGMATGKSATH
jgi:hypothetical protein